jgi:beta-galactosidase
MTIFYGADYYPEHWPRERWDQDARMMQEAGFNVARLAEFAWCRMEPEPGRYDFAWLDEAIATLGARGIQTVLGTPTATPPLWLTRRYPEILGEDDNGHVMHPGSRRHYCFNAAVYREESRRITRAMAEHFAANPNVIGWQTDNEFGCHQSVCCCANCQSAWHQWLKEKYGDIREINRRWGTIVWSQEYLSFEDVPPLWKTPALPNPSLALEYRRFQSESAVRFQRDQVAILREVCPQQFVTHNAMGWFRELDYYDLFADLDFVSWDNYPGFYYEGQPPRTDRVAGAHAIMRGVKEGKGFWVMEQQAGPTTWFHTGSTPAPGQLRLWAWQSVAHGADGLVYFRWRTNRMGAEQFWHGILDHNGLPNRRYAEVARTGQELHAVWPLLEGSRPFAEVALLHRYDVGWAFDIQKQSPAFSYTGQFQDWHQALLKAGYPADIVGPGADLSRYKLVVVPSLYLAERELVAKLAAYVQAGGHLVLTARSGVKDGDNICVEQVLPGALAGLAGVQVLEYDSLLPGSDQTVVLRDGRSYPVHGWADLVTPVSAEVLATYGHDYYAGVAAVTRNERVYYVGTLPGPECLAALAPEVAAAAGCEPLPFAGEGVEVAARISDGRRVLFILNHGSGEARVPLRGTLHDALTERRVQGELVVPPLGVAVLTDI